VREGGVAEVAGDGAAAGRGHGAGFTLARGSLSLSFSLVIVLRRVHVSAGLVAVATARLLGAAAAAAAAGAVDAGLERGGESSLEVHREGGVRARAGAGEAGARGGGQRHLLVVVFFFAAAVALAVGSAGLGGARLLLADQLGLYSLGSSNCLSSSSLCLCVVLRSRCFIDGGFIGSIGLWGIGYRGLTCVLGVLSLGGGLERGLVVLDLRSGHGNRARDQVTAVETVGAGQGDVLCLGHRDVGVGHVDEQSATKRRHREIPVLHDAV
jgi:hypothetical protein